jgi:hypothetical protein
MVENRELTWRHFKALYEIYQNGFTRAKIKENSYIKYLFSQKKILGFREGNHAIIESRSSFKSFYERDFLEDFIFYERFLRENDLESDARRVYDEYDIKTLIFIKENKANLLNDLPSLNTFSSRVFRKKGSKHLKNHVSLKKAVYKLLEVDYFPGDDKQEHQWRLVVDNLEPRVIVLCENLDLLKDARRAKKNGVELWYVGGNNIKIVDDISNRRFDLPIFYICDWDFDGLRIYCRLFEKVKAKGLNLQLLSPPDFNYVLPTNSPNHYSLWRYDVPDSGLTKEYFIESHWKMAEELIKRNQWIEEQTMDLFQILELNTGLKF